MMRLDLSKQIEFSSDRTASQKEGLRASGLDRSPAPAGYEVALCLEKKEGQKSLLCDQDELHEMPNGGRKQRCPPCPGEGVTHHHCGCLEDPQKL